MRSRPPPHPDSKARIPDRWPSVRNEFLARGLLRAGRDIAVEARDPIRGGRGSGVAYWDLLLQADLRDTVSFIIGHKGVLGGHRRRPREAGSQVLALRSKGARRQDGDGR